MVVLCVVMVLSAVALSERFDAMVASCVALSLISACVAR